jgi:hypothetical protein
MKKLSRILMMMLVLSVGTGITSCDEIEDMIDNPVVPEPTPTPTPQPEPQPQPEPTPQPTPEEIEAQRITEVQTLMEESRQEGSITEVYYTEDGVEKVANFKRVGNKYVLQTSSATRGDNDGSLVPGLMDDDSDEDLEDDDDDDDDEIQEEFINDDNGDDDGDDDDDCDVIFMPFDEDEIEDADDDDDESAAGSRMMTRGKTNVKNALLYFTDISTGRDGYQISLYHNSGTFSVVMDDEVKVTSISFGGKVAVNGKVFYVKQKAETRAKKQKKIKIRKVKFKNNNQKMPLQANLILQVQIAPANARVKKITWKLKNNKIAEVKKAGKDKSKNLVKCTLTSKKKSGDVKITCTIKGYKNTKKCSCTVTVTNAYFHPVEGVTVNPSSLSLIVGEKVKLSYTISPAGASYKKVIWNSSDDDIVSVKNGTIEAHNVGTATITVTTIDGGYTDVCIVTVNAPEDPNSTLAKPDNFNSGDSPF